MNCWILPTRYKQYWVKIIHTTATIACQLFVESLHTIFPVVRSFKGKFFLPILSKSYKTHTILPAARGDPLADCTPCARWGKYGHQPLGFKVACNGSSVSMHRPNFPVTWISSEKLPSLNPGSEKEEDSSCTHSHITCSSKSSREVGKQWAL